MESHLNLIVKWANFPAIPHSNAELLITTIRKTVLQGVQNKLFEQIPTWIEAQASNICLIELVLDPLPPETDFNMPSLLTILDSSFGCDLLPTGGRNVPSSTESNPDASSTSELNTDTSSSINADPAVTVGHAVHTAYRVVADTYKHNLIPPKRPRGRKVAFLMHKPARNQLRYSRQFLTSRREFNGGRDNNLFAALLQATGTRKSHKEKCQRCNEGRGPWDSCVVSAWGPQHDFKGACANCHYNGKTSKCSFFKGNSNVIDVPPEEKSTQSPHYVFTVHAYCYKEYTQQLPRDKRPLLDFRQPLRNSSIETSGNINVTSVSDFRQFYIPLTAQDLLRFISESLQSISETFDVASPSLPATEELLLNALCRNQPT